MPNQPNSSLQGPDVPDAFKLRLPFPTIPTNLPGVYAHPPLSNPDIRSTSPTELLRQGFLIPKPAPDAPPAALRAWNTLLSVQWKAENHIVPDLEPQPGRIHLRTPHRAKGVRENSTFSTNWSGSELGGAWSGVTAGWTVPTVSKPTEHSGPGGWDSSSWIGIGGDVDFNSTDLLQSGITQKVDTSGHTSYYAWYEWIDDFRRVTLGVQTPSTYALTAVSLDQIFIAFRGEQDHLDIMLSKDMANTFGNKLSSNETTSQGPALVVHNGLLLVAWSGHGNNKINVAQVDFSSLKLTNKVTLSLTSESGPALASLDGILYLGWRGTNDRITAAASTDNGASFSQAFVSNETTPDAPTLTAHDRSLLIGWKGDGNDFLNVATVGLANGLPDAISNKLTIQTETTSANPSLASQNGVLFLAWKNSNNNHINVMQSTDSGRTFFDKFTSTEESPSGPTLCPVTGIKLLIGWRGNNDYLDLAAIGMRNGNIGGFGPDPAYFNEVKIKNFDVHPGDSIACTILYARDLSSGTIYLGNVTTGKHFGMTIAPLFQAEMDGEVIEWIMEAPTYNNQQTVIAKFTPVVFTTAIGCSFTGQVGNAGDGEISILVDKNGTPMTAVALASDEVTIDFIG
jgi:Peptidase A4 family